MKRVWRSPRRAMVAGPVSFSRGAKMSKRYTEEEQNVMAARLDAAIELSALCMDLALAGRLQREREASARPSKRQQGGSESSQL